jgi:hypothetical protein
LANVAIHVFSRHIILSWVSVEKRLKESSHPCCHKALKKALLTQV